MLGLAVKSSYAVVHDYLVIAIVPVFVSFKNALNTEHELKAAALTKFTKNLVATVEPRKTVVLSKLSATVRVGGLSVFGEVVIDTGFN